MELAPAPDVGLSLRSPESSANVGTRANGWIKLAPLASFMTPECWEAGHGADPGGKYIYVTRKVQCATATLSARAKHLLGAFCPRGDSVVMGS